MFHDALVPFAERRIIIMDVLEILRNLKEDADFEESTDFIEDGLLDSFEIVELVSALEDAFEIEISGRDIIPENFVSVEAIEELIEKYR